MSVKCLLAQRLRYWKYCGEADRHRIQDVTCFTEKSVLSVCALEVYSFNITRHFQTSCDPAAILNWDFRWTHPSEVTIIRTHFWIRFLRRGAGDDGPDLLCLCIWAPNLFWASRSVILFADTFRTSARSRRMWARPEPGSASLWRRSCSPDTWSSCFQTTSLQSEQNNTKVQLYSFTILLLYCLTLTFFPCLWRNVCLVWNQADVWSTHL